MKYLSPHICTILLCVIQAVSAYGGELDTLAPSDKMRGVCWVGRDSVVTQNFDGLRDLSANWISLTAYGWMNAYDQPSVTKDNSRYWWGEKDQGILHTANTAHERGIKTLLKPHIVLPRASGKWREDIKMSSKSAWAQWFNNYEAWIMHYARLAKEGNIDALCIGTELYRATSKYPDKWIDIIRKIRTIYHGELIYAANWYKEYSKITFWDELDYIGIQGYFPIAKSIYSDKDDFIKSWKKYKRSISKIHKRYGKPVVFTEIGYVNHHQAAKRPWIWPQDINEKQPVSTKVQTWAYESFFESLWQEDWFHGAFIWEWHHPTYKEKTLETYNINREKRLALWQSQSDNNFNSKFTFSPQQSPALNVIKKWYQKQNQKKS